jgi:hypothetical protein
MELEETGARGEGCCCCCCCFPWVPMLFLLGPIPKSAKDLFVPEELEGLWGVIVECVMCRECKDVRENVLV